MGLFDVLGNLADKISTSITGKKDSCYAELVSRMDDDWLAMRKFAGSMTGYVHMESYRGLVERSKQTAGEAGAEYRSKPMFKTQGYIDFCNRFAQFQQQITLFTQKISEHNEGVVRAQAGKVYDVIGQVEGTRLDQRQLCSIALEAHSHLVVAGAGTGKTTTILGKVKYLLKTGAVKPSELLVLSFTAASATEMKNRLLKETDESIYVATFHKLGYDIIRRAEKITPRVYTDSLRDFVLRTIEELMQDLGYARLLLDYISVGSTLPKSEFEFKDLDEYREYLETNPPKTLKGEEVKSYGEMNIANYLARMGIRYEYEREYPIDTRTEEFKQYAPDFYLPDYDIYIEYYGVNRRLQVPDYFQGRDGKTASQIYVEGMAWKQKLHQENGTRLIACYAYENMEGILQESLEKQLIAHNVELKEVPFEALMNQCGDSARDMKNVIADGFATVISLARNRQMTPQQLLAYSESVLTKNQRCAARAIAPVMEEYEKYLRRNGLVDFTDMLNNAAKLITEGRFVSKFRYVIVDEYQDLSAAQYRLLSAMRAQQDYDLFCVGDDWQSIYRFAGSDIGFILNFEKYWEGAEISRIETTYRFSQRLIDISGDFIMQNPNQLRKRLHSGLADHDYVLGQVHGFTDDNAAAFMIDRIEDLPKGSSVFFLGRYQFDVNLLRKAAGITLQYDNAAGVQRVVLKGREDLNMSFYTAHKSKGLQADYVFIINNKKDRMGFPSRVTNPPLVEILLEQADQFPDAEERRLYYVALTRAKKKVFLVTTGYNISPFAAELLEQYGEEIKSEQWTCPLCGGRLRKVNGPYGNFFGCSNYRETGCRYKRKMRQKSEGE